MAQPTITRQPQSCTNLAGTTAIFAVEASGALPLTHQWQKLQATWYNLPDSTNDALVLTNVQSSHAGSYRVVVTDASGSTNSEPALLVVTLPPSILAFGQPTNFPTLSLGATVGNRVLASGTQPLAYQW